MVHYLLQEPSSRNFMRKSTYKSENIVVLRKKEELMISTDIRGQALHKLFHYTDNLGTKKQNSYSRLHNEINKVQTS